MRLNLHFAGQEPSSIGVTDLSDASRKFREHIETHDFGGSDMRTGCGLVMNNNREQIARVSYNGKVWNPAPWTPNSQPIMEAR